MVCITSAEQSTLSYIYLMLLLILLNTHLANRLKVLMQIVLMHFNIYSSRLIYISSVCYLFLANSKHIANMQQTYISILFTFYAHTIYMYMFFFYSCTVGVEHPLFTCTRTIKGYFILYSILLIESQCCNFNFHIRKQKQNKNNDITSPSSHLS